MTIQLLIRNFLQSPVCNDMKMREWMSEGMPEILDILSAQFERTCHRHLQTLSQLVGDPTISKLRISKAADDERFSKLRKQYEMSDKTNMPNANQVYEYFAIPKKIWDKLQENKSFLQGELIPMLNALGKGSVPNSSDEEVIERAIKMFEMPGAQDFYASRPESAQYKHLLPTNPKLLNERSRAFLNELKAEVNSQLHGTGHGIV